MRQLLSLTSVRYVLVGGGLAVLDFSVFFALVRLGDLPIPWAQLAARATGALAGFVLHRSWTFGGEGEHRLSLPVQGTGFAAINLFNLVVSPFVVTFFAWAIPFSLLLAKVVAEAFIAVESYFLTRMVFTRNEP